VLSRLGGDHRLLLIDDDPASTGVLAAMLRGCGYDDLIVTNDPGAAGTLCRRSQPDLVLLAVRTPEPGGLTPLRELPAETRGVPMPVLALTGDDTPHARRDALAAGAQDFVSKPFDHDEVRLRVHNLLQTRGLAATVRRQRDEVERRVAQRTEDLELARVEALERLARTAEFRDDATGEHPGRVGRTAALLAPLERPQAPPMRASWCANPAR
jgi:putative two-component system response regulator